MNNKNQSNSENLETLTYYVSNGIIIFLSLAGIVMLAHLDN